MNVIGLLIVGVLAGWLAGLLVKGGDIGLIGDLVVGILGALIGGLCSLSRSSQRVFDGPCQLKQVMQGRLNRYEVRLQNGNLYVFTQQGGGYVIRDGFGGSWPVTFVDHGNTGIFRFGDYKLVATQQNINRGANSRDAAVGNALGNLLNSLFQ